MKLTDQCILPAPPETVWRALNDPVVLQACLPGCKSLEMLDDRHFESTVQIRVGPVAATFKSPRFAHPGKSVIKSSWLQLFSGQRLVID